MKQRVRTSSSHCLSDATGMMHSMVLPNPGCPGVARQSVILIVIVSRSSSGQLQRPQLQCCCRTESSFHFFADRTVSSPALRVPQLCWPGRRPGHVICRRWYVGLLPVSLEFSSWSCFSLICPGSSWQFMQTEHRPAPVCFRCERQSNGGYAPPALIALALPRTVLNSFFSPGVGRPPEVAFALCSSPLSAQSDGFSDTIKSVEPADRQGSISARTAAGMWDCSCSFCTQVVLIDFM